ncbi:MAG: beta-propeller domain-containing protein [Thermoplasmata archaeon]|nr:MAG: beta-propeller domain-containing protein [Thermoplasmata archaeon]
MDKRLFAVVMSVAMAFGGILGFYALQEHIEKNGDITPLSYDVSYSNLNKFNSYQELEDFLDENAALSGNDGYYYYWNLSAGSQYYRGEREVLFGGDTGEGGGIDTQSDFHPAGGEDDHSETNVQVEGVDEGDIVKNDDKYAYIVSSDRSKVFIVDVYPPEGAEIVSTIELDWDIIELYISDDKLVVVGMNNYLSDYYYWKDWEEDYYYETPKTNVNVYDVEDRGNPDLVRSVHLAGSFFNSRTIGDYLYLIITQPAYDIEEESDLPTKAQEIYYADEYDYYYVFTSIISINIKNDQMEPNKQVILMGSSTHLYASLYNIYLTYLKRMSWVEMTERMVEAVVLDIVPPSTSREIQDVQNSDKSRFEKLYEIDGIVGGYMEDLKSDDREDFYDSWEKEYITFQEDLQKEIETTTVHRIMIDTGSIKYMASGGVPGYILNRFSMDEHDSYFRMATTTGQLWGWGDTTSKNHVFVLNMELEIIGAVENLAEGERIFSARFMGKRAYLVTFKNIDPFFVIDLSNPQSPQVLGELKIPGFSNYLHPYDENHVIGIGKDAVDMGDFAWFQGVKLSLFDVTDVKNPKEVSTYIVGDRGTDSLALTDPHAFLFSKNKNLLVIPVLLAEIDESKYPDDPPPSTGGEYTFYGAYVFDISTTSGINLDGRISHDEDMSQYYNGPYYIKRSFYIQDVLYTVSGSMIKANNLDDLTEVNTVDLTG